MNTDQIKNSRFRSAASAFIRVPTSDFQEHTYAH